MSREKYTNELFPDLTEKVIIITGGNSGLGFESAKALAAMGAHIVLASRSEQKAELTRETILHNSPDACVEIMQLDLADLSSVKIFSSNFLIKFKRLDVLMNNAGIMSTPYQLTKDGFESQFGTNHLGHFALTAQLINILSKTPESRVVNVSSLAHKSGKMDFYNLMFENGKYDKVKAYCNSKLANLLFTYELQRYFDRNSIQSISVAAHPGISLTNLGRHIRQSKLYRFFNPMISLFRQDQAKGALPQIRAAIDPNAKGSDFFGPDGFFQTKGKPVLVKPAKRALSEVSASRLWRISEELTSIHF